MNGQAQIGLLEVGEKVRSTVNRDSNQPER